jgi:hypothetical protein
MKLALLLCRISDMTQTDCVHVVLEAFRAMGATEAQLAQEKQRLEADPLYLEEWTQEVLQGTVH